MKKINTFDVCMLLVLCACSLNAQFLIKGKVTDQKQLPVNYAVVGLKGSLRTTQTNSKGEFTLEKVGTGKQILSIKCMGYKPVIDTVSVDADVSIEYVLSEDNTQLDEVVVNTNRVNQNTGMAFSNLTAEELSKNNFGKDAPILLDQLTSVVVNTDAGNGVGYTGMRIRGSDATRVNVTINGVPVNDAESQGTFFVNMPDFISSVNSIQVQRGVGASSNGAGAFGATVNFQTNALNIKPYAHISSMAGSFNTLRNSVSVGTGLMNDRFSMDVRASKITSDGYIDRAFSDLGSLYLSAGYYGKKDVLKFIGFTGKEKTYQAWYYVNEDSIKKGNRTDNSAGMYIDEFGNVRYYSNETDNYRQDNYQLHYIRTINSRLNFNAIAHYTKGRGYYEQYKQGESFSKYELNNIVTSGGDTITQTDLVRRLWLDNDFIGGIMNVNYKPMNNLSFTLGGGYNTYLGWHFGRIMWAQMSSFIKPDHEYYRNSAFKTDANAYLKINYNPMNDLYFFIDLQQRMINYSFKGYDRNLALTDQNVSLSFFNPKVGFSYQLAPSLLAYGSFAIGNKEPNRDDFTNSTPDSRPRSEQMMDLEFGARYTLKKLLVHANFYNMAYNDQLVLNGKVNDVGAYTRVNVDKSYRRGIEIEATVEPTSFVSFGGNITLSKNKIVEFKEYIDDYDNGIQVMNVYSNTDISFSPNLISAANVTLKPLKGLELALINKYVGRQYLDNTQKAERSIDPYNVVDVRLNYNFNLRSRAEIQLMFTVCNVLNKAYETNGYTYGYYYGGQLNTFNFLAPAAPTHYMGGVVLKF